MKFFLKKLNFSVNSWILSGLFPGKLVCNSFFQRFCRWKLGIYLFSEPFINAERFIFLSPDCLSAASSLLFLYQLLFTLFCCFAQPALALFFSLISQRWPTAVNSAQKKEESLSFIHFYGRWLQTIRKYGLTMWDKSHGFPLA